MLFAIVFLAGLAAFAAGAPAAVVIAPCLLLAAVAGALALTER